MTVQHSTGTLDVVDGNVVARMSGTRGLFKKETWQKTEVLPIKRLARVQKITEANGWVTLAFQRKYGDLPVGFSHCTEQEDIEALLDRLSEDIVVEADGVVWQAFRADIRAGSPDVAPSVSPSGRVAPKHCGNCGAPFDVTAEGKCVHCRAVLTTGG